MSKRYVSVKADDERLFPKKELESIEVYRVRAQDMAWQYLDTYEKARDYLNEMRDYLNDYRCGDITKVRITCHYPQYGNQFPGENGCSLDFLLTGDWTDVRIEEIPWEEA